MTLQERIEKAAAALNDNDPSGSFPDSWRTLSSLREKYFIAGAQFGISLERERVARLVEASTKAYEAMTKLDWKGGAVGPQWLTDLFDAIAKWKEGQ